MTVLWISTRPFPRDDRRVVASRRIPRTVEDDVDRIIVDLDAPAPGLDVDSLKRLVGSGRFISVLLPTKGAAHTPIAATELLGLEVSLITEPEFGLPIERTEEPAGIVAGSQSADVDFDTLLTTPASRVYISEFNNFLRSARRATALPPWDWRSGSPASDKVTLRQLLRVKGVAGKSTNGELFKAPSTTPQHQWDEHGRQPAPPPALLLLGESGTGKTLSARIAHQHLYPGDHHLRPFITVNAPALEGGRNFEATFFGATDAVFTDTEELIGPALQAWGGTLFIDEIADLSANAQSALLDFLNSRLARVHGLDTSPFVPVQIVAATNKDLDELSRSNVFRQDLLNRFGFTIRISALRERLAADPDELRAFLRRWLADPGMNPASANTGKPTVRKVEHGAFTELASRSYRSGNVRELQAIVRRAILTASTAGDDVVWTGDIPQRSEQPTSADVLPVLAIEDGIQRPYTKSRFRLWRFWVPLESATEVDGWALARFDLSGPPPSVAIDETYFDTLNGSLHRSGYTLRLKSFVSSSSHALILQSTLTADVDPQGDYETHEVQIAAEVAEGILAHAMNIPRTIAAGGSGNAMTAGLVQGLARGQPLAKSFTLRHDRKTFEVPQSHLVSIMNSELLTPNGPRELGSFLTLLHHRDRSGGPLLDELMALVREGLLVGDGRAIHDVARSVLGSDK